MGEIINGFMSAIFGEDPAETVTAFFRNGTSASYGAHMVQALAEDVGTLEIMDNQTGEILFYRD